MLERQGIKLNAKKLYRLYKEERLAVRTNRDRNRERTSRCRQFSGLIFHPGFSARLRSSDIVIDDDSYDSQSLTKFLMCVDNSESRRIIWPTCATEKNLQDGVRMAR
jgi:hypothetical protein